MPHARPCCAARPRSRKPCASPARSCRTMAAFEYSALDVHGRSREGVLDAGNAADARRLLQGRRLLPVRVEPATARSGQASRGRGRFGARDLTLLTRQLATLVAVAPLEEALRTIGSQSERAPVRRVVMAIHARLVEGFRLSDAMACEPRAFPPLYRAMVAAGEGTGALPAILERLADLHERDQQVRGKLVSALVYPAALAGTAVLVVIALMMFVVPKVVEQFESMGRELPLLTRIVIGVSEALATWWLPMLALLAAAVFAATRLLRRPGVRRGVDAALLRLPLLGRLLRDVHAARMARTLATMSDSGLPLIEGLAITARTVGN